MARSFLALLLAWIVSAPWASAQATTMYIETCGLGCSSGSAGGQVSCAVTSTTVNQVLRIRFSRPVDPVSVNAASFSIIDVNTGGSPIGARYVDPIDPQVVVFEPSLMFDAAGNPSFGFDANRTYRITIPGVAQGDSGPFVQSTDVPALDNQSRMQCDIQTSLGTSLTGTNSCFGNGGGTACPCGNNGNFPRGCPNSIDAHGAVLDAFGGASLAHDTVRLRGQFMSDEAVLYFQGTQSVNLGAGAVFGDGLLCVGGTLVRLALLTNSNAWSLHPNGGPTALAQGGQITTPGPRLYQAWYRNTAGFCTSATFNLTNSVSVTWAP